jgi:hypothetical protein
MASGNGVDSVAAGMMVRDGRNVQAPAAPLECGTP